MNNKLLSWILVVWIAATGFAGYSQADDTNTWATEKPNSEIRELFKKSKTDVALTADEQAQLAELKANRGEDKNGKRWGKHGKRNGMSFLSDDEKASLESMTDDEKKAFFTAKKEEKKAEREASQAIISKLINGESITDAERATLQEKQAAKEAKFADKGDRPEREENSEKTAMKAVITKLIAGETLTADEEVTLEAIKAKKEEREALKALKEKVKAGEELTEAEQAQVDAFKAEKWGKHDGKKKWKGKGWYKGDKGDRTEAKVG